MDEPLLRLELRGHPAVRATHTKTLEFGHDSSVTERATCVVGVGSVLVSGGAFAGPARFTIAVGDLGVDVDALGNPDWVPGGPAVVRRSSDRRQGTLATDADLASADLPREFVALLADPAVHVTVTARRLPRHRDGRAGLVLLWTPPGARVGERLRAELAAADVVVAQDAGAVELLGAAERARPASVGDRPERERLATTPADEAVDGLLDGGIDRVLVVATYDLPGAALAAALSRPDLVAVEVVGLPDTSAVVAASPVGGPVLHAGAVARGRIDAVLRAAPRTASVVATVAAGDLARLLEAAAARRGTATAAILEPGGRVRWGPVTELRAGRTGGDVLCLLDAVRDADQALDEDIAAFVRALLAEGVPPRTAALALAGLPGWSRRAAYDAVLALRPE